jgi:hypothetical protein
MPRGGALQASRPFFDPVVSRIVVEEKKKKMQEGYGPDAA